MTRSMPILVTAAMLASAWLAGCAPDQPYVTRARLERGLVVVLPGVEGRGPLNESIVEGLAAGGVQYAIELYDWTSALGPLYNLRAELRNRKQAGRLADRIVSYRDAYPARPVLLVGQSGGGGVAVWTAEQLAWSGGIEGVILIAPSLSPGYPLDRALSYSERGVVVFRSDRDWILLGTAITGTMDGEHAVSAGRVGFDIPEEPRRMEAYDKLYQIAWDPAMSKTGYGGGHLSSSAGNFIAAYVAPLVRARSWDRDFVSDLAHGQLEWPLRRRPATRPATTQPAQDDGDSPLWKPTTRPAGTTRPATDTHPATTQPAEPR